MKAWAKRFGLHLAAAIGATGIFVGAAAVGANQTRLGQEHVAAVAPSVVAPSPRPSPARPAASPRPTPGQRPAASATLGAERSVSGALREVLPEGELVVQGVGGRTWRVAPAPGALIRLNGKTAPLDALQPGDKLVIVGQPEVGPGQGARLVAHAITARRK